MTLPILHIGYHKTATTWFQKRYYPLVESHRYLPRRTVQEALLRDGAFRFDAAAARERLAAEADRPPVLCEEELSGNPHSAGMAGAFSKEVAGRLHAVFGEAQVVVFIRDQVAMAAALYRHYVREGGTHPPRRYFFPGRYRKDVARHPFKYPLFSFDHLDYGGLIGHYESLFGTGNVHVFPYEAFRADPAGFIAGFGERLGLEVDPARLAFGQENAGDGRNSLALARLANRLSYRSVLDKRWCLNLVSNKLRSQLPRWLDRTPLRGPAPMPAALLGRELVAEIRERFAEPNRRLMAACDLPLEALGYPCA